MRLRRIWTSERVGCSQRVKRAAGWGGIAAVSEATGVARSTIGRGLAELGSDGVQLADRVRRPGGGRKPAIETEPGLLEA